MSNWRYTLGGLVGWLVRLKIEVSWFQSEIVAIYWCSWGMQEVEVN